jgi:PAS domain S-box-containing protein
MAISRNKIASNQKIDSTIITKSSLLFVDIEDENNQKNVDIFKKLTNHFYTASTYEDTIKLYQENDTILDIIIINIDSPDINGIEIIKKIRENDLEIPILIISNFKNPNNLLQVLKLNIQNYIAKPILMNTTIRIIIEILNENENKKLIRKQQLDLTQFKEILDKQNLDSETDLKGNITYANDIFCEVSGYTKDELIGKPHNIVRHPHTSPKVFKELWDTIKSGNIWQGKVKNQAKDGSSYIVKALIVPMFDSDGNIIKYISSRFLITDEEKQKQMLKKHILSQKSVDFSNQKKCQKEINEALHKQEIEFDKEFKKLETTINDINSERKDLKRKLRSKEKRIFQLEDQIKDLMQKYDDARVQHYNKEKEKIEKNQDMIRDYNLVVSAKKKLEQEHDATHENIRILQNRIEQYLKRIDDLEDVIKSNGL